MRPGLKLEQMLRRSFIGSPLGMSQFFQPAEAFYQWMKEACGSRRVFDVGAGAGHVAKGLSAAGVQAIPLDIHRHQSPAMQVTMADGTAFPYEKGSVVM